jgi:hypothetical protein
MNSIPKTSFAAAARWLYTQNPFYLIGSLLMLCGLQQALGAAETLEGCALRMSLLGGFALALAAIAVLIIRGGQLWDDARTILLVIVLVLLLLSSCADLHLLEAFRTGAGMLAAGWLFAVLLSETLLWLLRLRLAAIYRGPYYLLLTLLFAYPLAPAWLRHEGLDPLRQWVTLAFPAVTAGALLLLLPAAGLASGREPPSGSPYRQPYYPWALFVFLTLGLSFRAWQLAVSFEPTKGAGTAFQPYYLFPVAAAWGVLILRMGVARGSLVAQWAGLALPTAWLLAAFPGVGSSSVEAEFLQGLTGSLGSPVQLILCGLLGVYAYAWLHGVRGAEGMLSAAGMGLAFVARTTLSLEGLTEPQPLLLGGVAGFLLLQALRRDSLARAVAAAAVGALAWKGFGWRMEAGDDFLVWRLPLVLLLLAPALFEDRLARWLRSGVWPLVPAVALGEVVSGPWVNPAAALDAQVIYFAALLGVSSLYWVRLRHAPAFGAALLSLAANGLMQLRVGYRLLEETALASGLPWLAAGAALVAVGLAISLGKMNFWRYGRYQLRRWNRSLAARLEPWPKLDSPG